MILGEKSLKIRFTLFFILFVLAVFSVIAIMSFQQLNDAASFTASRLGMPIVKRAAALVDGDKFENFCQNLDENDPFYDETRRKLLALKLETQCLYLYTMAPYKGNIHRFIIDGGNPGEEGFSPLGSEEDVSGYSSAYLRAYASKSPQYGDINLQESWGWVLSTYMPILNSSGNVVGIIGCDFEAQSVFDAIYSRIVQQVIFAAFFIILALIFYFYLLKALTRQNDMLYEMNRKAEIASRSKSEFLSNMSHEMRTPMNAIVGMTSLGRQASDITRKDYAFSRIGDAATHLLGVINDILDMSKIEANKLELSKIRFNFEKMLRHVVNVVISRMEERGQHFYVSLDRSLPVFLLGDDQRLAQVLTNLLSNAVKFTPEGGIIRLNVRLLERDGDLHRIQMEVSDTGIGISREEQARLFQPFEQAESGTSRKFGGTGLGLAISRRIVGLMGGDILLESDPGEGSTFIVVVQLEQGDGGDETGGRERLNGLRVLFVDSDPQSRILFEDIAERFHITCDIVGDKSQAFALVADRGCYDACLTDWKTLGADWKKFVRELGEKSKNCSIVMIMTFTEWNALEEEAGKLGVKNFLPKPLFPSSVGDCLEECLESRVKLGMPQTGGEINSFQGATILLAEDVEINREIVCAFLEPVGFIVDCVENGAEALRMFSENPGKYSMIFMDVQMPEMDGYEATRRIRALDDPRAKQIPVVAMTANVFREDIERCLAAGMNDHVGKPVNFDDVFLKLRRYMN
jgi:signal transduction histidine kinase/DNA-binding response OmpR family regulator